ncbi:uncharacterized protein LOC125008536 [Mugil cephalus]|uniref:uncharacterized protein LOC125008536 n=1 Tax=Mugil cephalus TaxID=48193 RepID=UPI001FB63DFF|nr:uncharacterized protein LOC125008536 [Mugil cephalus]
MAPPTLNIRHFSGKNIQSGEVSVVTPSILYTLYISIQADAESERWSTTATLPVGRENISRLRQECYTTMIGRLAALILLSAASLIETSHVSQLISLTVVKLGDNVTFHCKVPGNEAKSITWYKQPLGHMVQIVGRVVKNKPTVDEQFKDSRFTITEVASQYFLTIRNVSKDEEATYFCVNGDKYSATVVNTTFLTVKDCHQHKSVYVEQRLKSEPVQPGGSPTLQCSLLSSNKKSKVQCPGEQSVFWFRAGSQGSLPSVVYTHSNSSDEDVERRCVYSLSKSIQDSTDAGTYYCAVVTCGEILFGEGTKVETKCLHGSALGAELDPIVLVLGLLLASCVTVIVLLIVYIKKKNVCGHYKGENRASHCLGHDVSTVDQSDDLHMYYAAVDFSTRRVKMKVDKKKEKTRESQSVCVYSAVRSGVSRQTPPL